MPDAEQDTSINEPAIYAVVAQMLRRNDWQLLVAAELAQRAIALLRNQQREPAESHHRPPPERSCAGNPVEAAALYSYSEVLYAAFAGHEGEERQHRAYAELLRYISRVLYRKAATLSSHERDELAYEIIAELYYRLPPGQQGLPQRIVRVPGAFIALALQETRNALQRWHNAARHLQRSEEAAVNGHRSIVVGDAATSAYLISDDLSADIERSEQRDQVRECFVRTWQRYPRARLQLYVVWLHVVEGQDHAQIASLLRMNVENVRVLFSRGCKRLRQDLEWLSLAVEEGLPGALHVIRCSTQSAEFQRGQDHD